MKIRKSRPEDLERMLRLYADARIFMAEHGNPTQWANGYPEPEMLQEDIRAGVSYVCEDDQGRVVGTFVFFVGEDEGSPGPLWRCAPHHQPAGRRRSQGCGELLPAVVL